MNIKELVMPVAFALIATVALQYLFFGNNKSAPIQTSFVAQKAQWEYRPLDREVDFFDKKRPQLAQQTDVETTWGIARFSTDGATLESLDIKREIDGSEKTIRTIFPVTETERENRCFLVGLSEKTPFYYTLVSVNEEENAYRVEYKGENDVCVIHKTFNVQKEVPQINITLEIVPRSDSAGDIVPRIIYPAPLMPDIRDNDVISSLVIDQTHIFSKKNVDQLTIDTGWFEPTLFGSDSRYFIHAMIDDTDVFAKRAYYKLENRDRLFSILEGPRVTETSTWHVSFYMGPKDVVLLSAVDSRLEQALDFSGWISHIAKIMLYILNWFFKYLHNYGLAIIALTLLIHILLLPFTLRNNEEKLKKQQRDYQTKLAMIELRFKDNPEKMALEKAELIKKEGLPGGLGCLIPFLLQIPIFFALNRIFSSSFELYQAPLLWIKDLSAKDPYYILPLLITVLMLVQDGKGDTQQRMIKTMAALVFGAVASSFSAGLALYWACNRFLTVVQTTLMKYFKLV